MQHLCVASNLCKLSSCQLGAAKPACLCKGLWMPQETVSMRHNTSTRSYCVNRCACYDWCAAASC